MENSQFLSVSLCKAFRCRLKVSCGECFAVYRFCNAECNKSKRRLPRLFAFLPFVYPILGFFFLSFFRQRRPIPLSTGSPKMRFLPPPAEQTVQTIKPPPLGSVYAKSGAPTEPYECPASKVSHS